MYIFSSDLFNYFQEELLSPKVATARKLARRKRVQVKYEEEKGMVHLSLQQNGGDLSKSDPEPDNNRSSNEHQNSDNQQNYPSENKRLKLVGRVSNAYG